MYFVSLMLGATVALLPPPVGSFNSVCDTENSYNFILDSIPNLELKTWNTPGRKRMRLRKPTATLIQPVSVYMSTLPENDFPISDILPPEMPLQIFLAAAKRCDSCLYGRAQHKADGLQGSSQLVRRHCGQKPGTTREVTTVRFSPPWKLLQPHKLCLVPGKHSF